MGNMAKNLQRRGGCAVRRRPGKHKSFLEMPRFAQSVKARLPVLTVTGAHPGPLAVIMAGQHGRELNGLAAIEKVFHELDPQALKGTAVFLPVLNPLAVLMRRQDFPAEEFRYRRMGLDMLSPRPSAGPDFNYNMDRCWRDAPASDTYASVAAEMVWQTWLRHADWGMDLHGWTSAFAPLAWSMLKDLPRSLCAVSACPVINCGRRAWRPAAGMSSVRAFHAGIPLIVAELPPQTLIRHPRRTAAAAS